MPTATELPALLESVLYPASDRAAQGQAFR
jgi:hypothetical protein